VLHRLQAYHTTPDYAREAWDDAQGPGHAPWSINYLANAEDVGKRASRHA
jgi:hypothetical protein